MKSLILSILLIATRASALTYSQWAATVFSTAELANPAISGSNAVNPAGVPNLVSYAFANGNPHSGTITNASLVTGGLVTETGTGAYQGKSGGQYYQASFMPRQGVTDVRIRPEISNDLASWTYGPDSLRTIQTGTTVIVRSTRRTQLTGGYNRWFVRAKVGPVGAWFDPTVSASGSSGLPQIARPDFRIQSTPLTRVISSGSTALGVTVGNKVVDQSIPATTVNDIQISFLPSGNYSGQTLAPAVAVSGSAAVWSPGTSVLSYISSGTVTFQASTNTVTHSADFVFATTTGASVNTFDSWVAGSLGAQMDSAVDTLVAASGTASLPGSLAMFSTISGTTYVRNSSCWLTGTGIDMTGMSPCNSGAGSGGATNYAGTLVSPRHLIFANHYHPGNGAVMRFIKANGTIITRTLVGQQQVGSTDIQVGILDSDVPAGICFYPVAPSTLNNYASDHQLWPIPLISTDQVKGIYLNQVQQIGGGNIVLSAPSSPSRIPFTHLAIGGDSGSPLFFLVKGHLVLAGCYFATNQIPDLSAYGSMINTVMHALSVGSAASTDYQLTIADLSGFASY